MQALVQQAIALLVAANDPDLLLNKKFDLPVPLAFQTALPSAHVM